MKQFNRNAESLITPSYKQEENTIRDAINEEIESGGEDSKEAYVRTIVTAENLSVRYLGTPNNILIAVLALFDGLETDQKEMIGDEYPDHYILQRFLEVYDHTHDTNFSNNKESLLYKEEDKKYIS